VLLVGHRALDRVVAQDHPQGPRREEHRHGRTLPAQAFEDFVQVREIVDGEVDIGQHGRGQGHGSVLVVGVRAQFSWSA
jgi:hypothetical protein